MNPVRKREVELIILSEGARISLTDPEMGFVEIEVEAGDVLAREECESVIDLARPETVLRTGGRDFDGVIKSERRHSPGLLVDSDLRTDPIISDPALCSAGIGLPEV